MDSIQLTFGNIFLKKSKAPLLLLLFWSLISCTTDSSSDDSGFIQIHAGDVDRVNSIISVELPVSVITEEYQLLSENGQTIPIQREGNEITFLLPSLKAGESIRLELDESTIDSTQKMGIRFLTDAIELSNANSNPILQYRTGPEGLDLQHVDEIYHRGGYIHPLFTPNGHILTQQYTDRRPHQNGIWTGWYGTEWNGMNPNFWIQDEGTGEVKVHSVDKIRSGNVYAEIQTTHHFIEKITGNLTPVLSDKWKIRAYAITSMENREIHLFDLEVEQTNITDSAFRLSQYIYGGVGFRGNDQWIGDGNMQLLTSEDENRQEAHMSRARWVLLSGMIDQEMTHIAILAHPDNVRFPEPIFVNQQEPFFIFAPLQLGDLSLNPNDTFKAKYRYVLLDGNSPSKEFVERLWKDYAEPPRVEVNFD